MNLTIVKAKDLVANNIRGARLLKNEHLSETNWVRVIKTFLAGEKEHENLGAIDHLNINRHVGVVLSRREFLNAGHNCFLTSYSVAFEAQGRALLVKVGELLPRLGASIKVGVVEVEELLC